MRVWFLCATQMKIVDTFHDQEAGLLGEIQKDTYEAIEISLS